MGGLLAVFGKKPKAPVQTVIEPVPVADDEGLERAKRRRTSAQRTRAGRLATNNTSESLTSSLG